MDMNTDYSTTILAISTASLVVITAYYAKQTHDLTRNQFRPFVFPSITWSSQNEIDFDLFLCLNNISAGAAYSMRVENSVNGAKNSQQEWMVRLLEHNQDYTIGLVQNGSRLRHDRNVNRTIVVKLSYKGLLGKYKQNFKLDENDFFGS